MMPAVHCADVTNIPMSVKKTPSGYSFFPISGCLRPMS